MSRSQATLSLSQAGPKIENEIKKHLSSPFITELEVVVDEDLIEYKDQVLYMLDHGPEDVEAPKRTYTLHWKELGKEKNRELSKAESKEILKQLTPFHEAKIEIVKTIPADVKLEANVIYLQRKAPEVIAVWRDELGENEQKRYAEKMFRVEQCSGSLTKIGGALESYEQDGANRSALLSLCGYKDHLLGKISGKWCRPSVADFVTFAENKITSLDDKDNKNNKYSFRFLFLTNLLHAYFSNKSMGANDFVQEQSAHILNITFRVGNDVIKQLNPVQQAMAARAMLKALNKEIINRRPEKTTSENAYYDTSNSDDVNGYNNLMLPLIELNPEEKERKKSFKSVTLIDKFLDQLDQYTGDFVKKYSTPDEQKRLLHKISVCSEILDVLNSNLSPQEKWNRFKLLEKQIESFHPMTLLRKTIFTKKTVPNTLSNLMDKARAQLKNQYAKSAGTAKEAEEDFVFVEMPDAKQKVEKPVVPISHQSALVRSTSLTKLFDPSSKSGQENKTSQEGVELAATKKLPKIPPSRSK